MDNKRDEGFSADEKLIKKESVAPKKSGRKAALSQGEKKRLLIICIAAVLVLAAAATVTAGAIYARKNCQPFSLLTMFNLKPKGEVVIAGVNNVDITAAEYNYLYNIHIQQFVTENKDYLTQYGLDVNKDLAEQECGVNPGITWKQYFIYQTNDYVKQYALMYSKAIEDGCKLTEAEKKSVTDYIESMRKNAAEIAEENNIEYTLDDMITSLFGKTCTVESVSQSLERVLLAQTYMDKYLDQCEFSDETLEAYVSEHRDDFYGATYNIFTFEPEASTEDAISLAKEQARKFLEDVTTSADFDKQAYKFASDEEKPTYEAANATLKENMLAATIGNLSISDWLNDPQRKSGDKTVIYSSASGDVYALLFVGNALEDFKTMNLRVLYFDANTENFADFDAASVFAQTVKSEFEQAGADDAAFETIAAKYYKYDYSNTGGGFYKNMLPSEMQEALLYWCYATDRTAGEYDVIENADGYCIIYLSSVGNYVWQEKARQTLAEQDISNLIDDELAKATLEESKYFYELVGI